MSQIMGYTFLRNKWQLVEAVINPLGINTHDVNVFFINTYLEVFSVYLPRVLELGLGIMLKCTTSLVQVIN